MNPILASYITSAAQCKINDIQLRGLKEGVTTYYTDTDSVLTNKRLSFAVKGKQLGQLQHVGSFDELIIIGPKAKMTRHGNKTKPTFKGIPTKSFVIEDPVTMVAKGVSPKQQMFDTMTDDKLTVTYTRFAKYREAMIRGLSVNEMTEMTKEYQPFANPKREILGKPTIKKLLTQKFNSRPWRIDGKTQLVKSQGAKK